MPIPITDELKEKLISLAEKYEVSSFCDNDPSQFLRWYPKDQIADVECASFIAAMLSFGNRKQFIPKIKQILTLADTTFGNEGKPLSIAKWLIAGAQNFPKGEQKFYRFYSYDDMHDLFSELAQILRQFPTLSEYFKNLQDNKEGKVFPCLQPSPLPSVAPTSSATPSSGLNRRPQHPLSRDLPSQISLAFPNSSIVPKGKNSANKRIYMFLRWMVRQNSPVDLGIWTWANPSDLLIPLDVHVMQEAINLGLLPPNAKSTRKTAELLTEQLKQVFPNDPTRGDFALFGLGVDGKK